MKCWPLSILTTSPLMSWQFAPDFYRVQVQHSDVMPQAAMQACGNVALQTIPVDMPNLAIIDSIGATPKRIYFDYPEFAEWSQLERACVVQGDSGMLHLIIDALH